MKVTIAALTFRRATDLAALIPLLILQAESVEHDVDILIVDNDPDASAEAAMAAAGGAVRYEHEPLAGIAAGRNRALDCSLESDILVFIDDDERPSEDWLRLMLETRRTSGADAVVGPVVSRYPHELDEWIRAGRFFDRQRHATGTVVAAAATNNLLLDAAAVRRFGLRFSEEFSLTGGSDTMFTRQLAASGGRIVWCDEAVVYDVVPAGRMTRQWVIRRAFRSANSWSRVDIALRPSSARRFGARIRLTARGLGRLVVGTVQGLLGRSAGRLSVEARGARTASRGKGMIAGAWGCAYVEYARAAAPVAGASGQSASRA